MRLEMLLKMVARKKLAIQMVCALIAAKGQKRKKKKDYGGGNSWGDAGIKDC